MGSVMDTATENITKRERSETEKTVRNALNSNKGGQIANAIANVMELNVHSDKVLSNEFAQDAVRGQQKRLGRELTKSERKEAENFGRMLYYKDLD